MEFEPILAIRGFFAIAVVIVVAWWLRIRSKQADQLKKASRKRAERDAKHHAVLLEHRSGPGASYSDDIASLHHKYSRKELKCSNVTRHLIFASREIGRDKLVAVTEEFYDEAMERAVLYDETDIPCHNPPQFWGIPISIKDNYDQRGADLTCGVACRCFKPKSEDGLLVKLLRDAGAIPFVRTNVPQLLMMSESENNIFGCTVNPWDVTRTPGGSSGGEAALISSGCSIIGLGGDIGGSIRTPAHFTGICGFKPTPHRITRQGVSSIRYRDREGQAMIIPTCGPMARRYLMTVSS